MRLATKDLRLDLRLGPSDLRLDVESVVKSLGCNGFSALGVPASHSTSVLIRLVGIVLLFSFFTIIDVQCIVYYDISFSLP